MALTKINGKHRWTLSPWHPYGSTPAGWALCREVAEAKDDRNGHRYMATYFVEADAIAAFEQAGPKTKRQTAEEWKAELAKVRS